MYLEHGNIYDSGLDIGYVPAVPHAFLRLSGQFGPPQFIFQFFFFSASYAAIIFTGNRQNSEGNAISYLFFVISLGLMYKSLQLHAWNHKFPPRKHLGHYMFLGGQWVFWGASGFSDSLAPRASGCHSQMSRPVTHITHCNYLCTLKLHYCGFGIFVTQPSDIKIL